MFGSMLSLVSVLALAMPAVNAYATVGCYPGGVVTGLGTGIGALVIGELTNNIATAEACATRARALNRGYAYFDDANDRCYSLAAPPLVGGLNNAVGTLVGGVGSSVCGANQLQGLDVTTQYTDFGCALPVNTRTANRQTFILVPGLLAVSNCLATCQTAGFQFSFVTNVALDLTCSCATNVALNPAGNCGLGSNFVYRNQLLVPSGTPARRRALEQAKREQKIGACPSGLQACRVNQGAFASDDFECVDVQAELESCGGCTAGIIDGDAALATSGVDCTALPGVEMGAVSCVSGQCEISRCKRGYTLIDNTCTSTRSVASLALGALRLQNL